MNYKSSVGLRPNLLNYDHNEGKTVEQIAQEAVEIGLSPQRNDFVNIYVSMKSKPLLILAGPPHRGKAALLNYLGSSLTGGNISQYQTMIGHPWWANGAPDVAFLVGAQQRLNTERLLEMIEEAWRPQNLHKAHIACLTQISPAELLDYFRDVAFQLHHGQIMRLGDAHLSEPIPFPPNLFIMGTMNTERFDCWEADLLKKATIINWSPGTAGSIPAISKDANTAPKSSWLLGSAIRSGPDASRKLHAILGEYRTTDQKEPLLPLFRVENLLDHLGMKLPPDWLEEALIYLANSWTREGEGLYDRSPARNLSLAMDFAIAQSMLPYVKDRIQTIVDLQIGLKRILKDQFYHSIAFVDWLAQ